MFLSKIFLTENKQERYNNIIRKQMFVASKRKQRRFADKKQEIKNMRAVVTVMGQDRTGIIAKTSALLAEYEINILDITQTIIQNIFTMVMLVDIENCTIGFSDVAEKLDELSKELSLEMRIQHEDIFNSMHRI